MFCGCFRKNFVVFVMLLSCFCHAFDGFCGATAGQRSRRELKSFVVFVMLLSFSEGFAPLRAWRRRDDGGFCRVCWGMACSVLNATCFSERNVGVKPQPTMLLNKKPILQHLATPGFSLEREGPGKAYAATPKQLTYAKPERIIPDAYVSTGLFLFWFVFSFCLRTKRKNEQEKFSYVFLSK